MIAIGKVLKPQGLKGEIKVKPYNADAFLNLKGSSVTMNNVSYEVANCSVRCGFAYLKLSTIDKIEQAETLRDCEICISKESMPKLSEDEYLIEDMLGLTVVDDKGDVWGTVRSIEKYGSADVYTVVGKKGEHRFPFIADIIKEVNLEAKQIVVYADKFGEVVVCG